MSGQKKGHDVVWMFREIRLAAGVVLFLELLAGSPSSTIRALTPSNFHHTKWTSENGAGAVFDIQQSSEGYLWLTTSRGVLRFDGVRFQTVAAATFGAVETNEIDSVFHSSSGGLWLTTTSAGLLFWKTGGSRHFRTGGALLLERWGG